VQEKLLRVDRLNAFRSRPQTNAEFSPYRTLLMIAAVKQLCVHHPGMRVLQQAWQYGNEDPWKVHHMLDANYVGHDGEERRPLFPERNRAVILGFGQVAAENQMKLAKVGGGGR
jgi:hypothetical protein